MVVPLGVVVGCVGGVGWVGVLGFLVFPCHGSGTFDDMPLWCVRVLVGGVGLLVENCIVDESILKIRSNFKKSWFQTSVCFHGFLDMFFDLLWSSF